MMGKKRVGMKDDKGILNRETELILAKKGTLQ